MVVVFIAGVAQGQSGSFVSFRSWVQIPSSAFLFRFKSHTHITITNNIPEFLFFFFKNIPV